MLFDELLFVSGVINCQRCVVDVEYSDVGAGALEKFGVVPERNAQVSDAGAAQLVNERLDAGPILFPE